MHLPRALFLIPFLLAGPAFAGTPAEAEKIRQTLTTQSEQWEAKLKLAPDDESRRRVWAEKPDVKAAFMKMWSCVRSSLAEDWTLEYDAWLLRAYPSVTAGPVDPLVTEAVSTVRQAVEKYHIRSPKLSPVCLALVTYPDPMSLTLLEKIEAQNPDLKVQGVAALGQAMLLNGLSDDPEAMKKRLKLIRKAIINSADVKFDKVSVADIATNELYTISNLSKGRVAPDLVGVDSGGHPLKLSDYEGKTVVLLFWNSGSADLDHLLELTSAMVKRNAGKPFALIGVNNDPAILLSGLRGRAENPITWPNFSDPTNKLSEIYRINSRPIAYVLDGQRTIRYVGAPGSFVDLTVDAILTEKKPAPAPAITPPPAGSSDR